MGKTENGSESQFLSYTNCLTFAWSKNIWRKNKAINVQKHFFLQNQNFFFEKKR